MLWHYMVTSDLWPSDSDSGTQPDDDDDDDDNNNNNNNNNNASATFNASGGQVPKTTQRLASNATPAGSSTTQPWVLAPTKE